MSFDVDAVVVGGGLAGLGAAFRLQQRGLQVRLLEREDYLGGRTKSGRWEGYWYNLGAQFIGGVDTPVARLAQELGVQTTPIFEPHVAMFLKGQLVVGRSRLDFARKLPWSPWAKLNLLWTALRLRRLRAPMYQKLSREEMSAWRRKMDSVSFAQLLGRLHPDVEAFYRVVAEGITAAKMEEVSGYLGLAWTPGLGEPRTEESPDFEHFLAVENGTVSLAEELGRRLGDAALTGAEALEVTQDDAGVTVTYTRGGSREQLRATYGVVATTADLAGAIVRDLPEHKRRALEQVPYAPFVSCAFLTDEEGPMPWDHLFHIHVIGKSFQVLDTQAYVLRQRELHRRKGGAIFTMSITESARALLEQPEEQVRATVTRDLLEVLPQLEGHIVDVIVQKWPKGLPYWPVGRLKVRPVLQEPVGRIFFAGDYTDYGNMQGAFRTGEWAAAAIAERLQK